MIRGLRVPVHLTSRDSLRMFDLADIWAARTGEDVRLVSGNDHIHSRGSAHYEGEAVDFHSSNPDGLAGMLKAAGYRVLWKVPGRYAHVHAERMAAGQCSGAARAPSGAAGARAVTNTALARRRIDVGATFRWPLFQIFSNFIAFPPRIASLSALLKNGALRTKSIPTGQSKG